MVQLESFPEEIIDLNSQTEICKQSPIYGLSPFVTDDHLLRSNSRLKNADHLSFDQKFPVILPYGHLFSRLLVRHAHISMLHGFSKRSCSSARSITL